MRLRRLAATSLLLLAGCVSPQKLEKARTDFSVYSAERRQRDIEEHCANVGAMPGTPAGLECRLKLENPAPQKQPAN